MQSAVQSQPDLLSKLLCGFLCSWERSHSWLKTWRRREWMWDTKPGMLGMTCVSVPLLPQRFACLPCPRCPDPDCVSEPCWPARFSSVAINNLFYLDLNFLVSLMWGVWYNLLVCFGKSSSAWWLALFLALSFPPFPSNISSNIPLISSWGTWGIYVGDT